MKATKRTPIALLLLLLGMIFSLGGCGTQANGQEVSDGTDSEQEEETAIPVETAAVEPTTVYSAYNGTTTLEAEQEADIVAKTSGIILELLVEEGDRVEAGQVVARLDAERLTLEVQRAEANLRRLQNEFRRTRELHEKNLISSDAFEKARFDLESQQASYELARLELSYAEVRTPIEGVISERLVKKGNLIGLHEPLFRVDDFDPLLAVLYVPERELSDLEPGQKTMVSVDAIAEERFTGRLARISPVVDSATGTFKVTVELADPDSRLKPGMFGRVEIVEDVRENALTVPRDAVVMEDRQSYVYVIEDDRARRADVVTGYRTNGRIEIREGLTEGQQVVTSGKGTLSEDSLVEVINRPADETVIASAEDGSEAADATEPQEL